MFEFQYKGEQYHLHFQHIKNQIDKEKMEWSLDEGVKAITRCTVSKGENFEALAVADSICVSGDVFDKEFGRSQSLKRALLTDSGDTRKEVIPAIIGMEFNGKIYEKPVDFEVDVPMPLFTKEFRTAAWKAYFNRFDAQADLEKLVQETEEILLIAKEELKKLKAKKEDEAAAKN